NNGKEFLNTSNTWLSNNRPSYSNGAVYADLDNDGDLDLVINNINDQAFVLKNNTIEYNPENSYSLHIDFKGPENNPFGIGAKVTLYVNNNIFTQENFATRGYLSAVAPSLHFGLGTYKKIDSLKVQWSDGKYQVVPTIETAARMTLSYQDAGEQVISNSQKNYMTTTIGIKHRDNAPIEFNRDPLIPYALSNCGPNISIADINNDQLDDFFVSGGKRQASSLFIQGTNGAFTPQQQDLWQKTNLNEDVAHDFGDINDDGFIDLIVASGGNEFKSGKAIKPRVYLNNKGIFNQVNSQLTSLEINASKVELVDLDDDQDLDLCILADAEKTIFGATPKQYLFENNGSGNFKDVTQQIAPEFQSIGNVKDIMFTDINNDGDQDFVVIGHWMPITIFLNQGNQFIKSDFQGLENSNGWWNTLELQDLDKDGDLDLIVGNWGLNSRLSASTSEPITLYRYDFDQNGTEEPIVSYFYQGEETTFSSKEELEKQLPLIKKKYITHESFAKDDFEEIFSASALKKADKKQVYELASCYFENLGNRNFKKHILPYFAQISSVNDIFVYDFNNDSYLDVLIAGNNYEISTQLSKLDASRGEVLLNDQKGGFFFADNLNFDIQGVVQSLKKIKVQNKNFLLVARNNDSILSYQLDRD
ncbi:MAG: VCBS repeat-containing protein, partial [Flavobacteriaceae bacterium]|nr:VCBS repeat-containing protein [Flavobacteriaceae bacterium]